jgi:hypothetical protein
LGGLIDKQGREVPVHHDPVCGANQGASNDTSLVEQLCIDLDFQFGRPEFQTGEAVSDRIPFLPAFLSHIGLYIPYRFPDAP